MSALQSAAPTRTDWSKVIRNVARVDTGNSLSTVTTELSGGRLNTRVIVASPTHASCGLVAATMPTPGCAGITCTTRICEAVAVGRGASTTTRSTAPSTSPWNCDANATLAWCWSTNRKKSSCACSTRCALPATVTARSKVKSMRAPATICRPLAYTAVAFSSTGPAGIIEKAYSGASAVEAGLLAPDSMATKAPSSAISMTRPVRQRYDVTVKITVSLTAVAAAPSLTTQPSAERSCAVFVATSSTCPSNTTLTPSAASATVDTLSAAGVLTAPSTCSGTTAGVWKAISARSIGSPRRSCTQPAGMISVRSALSGHTPLAGSTSSRWPTSCTRLMS